MPRLLVVSRNAALAIALTMANYDVIDVRPNRLAEHDTSSEGTVDALILDLEDPELTLDTLNRLRAAGADRPALLVSSPREEWADVSTRAGADIRIMPFPLSRETLLATLDELLGRQVVTPPPVESPRPSHGSHRAGRTAAPPPPPPPPAAARTAAPPPAPPKPPAAPAPPRVPSTAPTAPATVTSAPPAPAKPPPTARPPAPAPATAPTPTVPPRPTAPAPPMDARAAVALLARYTGELHSLSDVGEIVVAEAVERTGSDAGAMLVPDDSVWRIPASIALRPIEQRAALKADHWLVREVATAQHGVIIEGSDIARERLHGAPLASRDLLLAVPVPAVEAVLLLARNEKPYEEGDLVRVAELAREAGPLLAAALELRRLARALSRFRDVDD